MSFDLCSADNTLHISRLAFGVLGDGVFSGIWYVSITGFFALV
jgi:hypothetical protein